METTVFTLAEDLKKKLRAEARLSEIRHVNIDICSAYKWGSGWTADDRAAFEADVYPKFRKAGYEVISSGKEDVCDSLKKEGSALDIYMHPMTFSGNATREEAEDIVRILGACKTCSVLRANCKDCYDITDAEYMDILRRHEQEIMDYIRVLVNTGNHSIATVYNYAGACVMDFHIPKFEDPDIAGYSPKDEDYLYFLDLVEKVKET